MKKNVALAYELTSNVVDKFINNISSYKDKRFIIFDVNLTNQEINKIKSICDCLIIKRSRIFKPQFIAFKYLKDFNQIIFTNVNIYLDDVFFEKYKDVEFASIIYPNNRFVEASLKKMFKKYHMFKPSHDLSLMIISNKINNYNKIANWCIIRSLILRFFLRNTVSGIIDLMIQKFNVKVTSITIASNDSLLETYEAPIQNCLNKKVDGELVSIVMPVYNRTDTLVDAVNSVVNQSYQNIELIIVVEKTNVQDKVVSIISKIKDNRIKIIRNTKKLGLAESLNVGIKESNGKYIVRMDDDDISDYYRIEKQINYLKENDDIAVVGSYMQFYGNSNLVCKLPTDSDELKVKCLYKTPLFHPTVMFNMNILSKKELVYNTKTCAEDYDLWSRLIANYKIANIPEVLYYYNLSGSNSSIVNEERLNDSHLKIMSYQLDKYLKMNLDFDELQLLSGRVDVLGHAINLKKVYRLKKKIWNRIIRSNNSRKFYNASILKNELKEIDTYYKEVSKIKR